MTDQEVIDFCKNGYVMLKQIVPDQLNQKTMAYLDEHPEGEPQGILNEEWFVDAVIKNPRVSGVVRSLLGENFKLPVIMSNHRVSCPRQWPCGWHLRSVIGSLKLNPILCRWILVLSEAPWTNTLRSRLRVSSCGYVGMARALTSRVVSLGR